MAGASVGKPRARLSPMLRVRSAKLGTNSCFSGAGALTVTLNEADPDFHLSVSFHVAVIVVSPAPFATTALFSTTATVAWLVA